MCGLVGFFQENTDSNLRNKTINSMMDALVHRGPDSGGSWLDNSVAFGHRRLAVIDPESRSNQPMFSQCGRWVIIFNGEIYNFKTLKKKLAEKKSIKWKTTSDVEVLVECIAYYGIRKSLELVSGMFAFAIWDTSEKKLILARDRMGEKPLYYGWQGNALLFASELDALCVHPNWQASIDTMALSEYLEFCNVPTDKSIYSGIKNLPPAHFIEWTYENLKQKKNIEPCYYWTELDEILTRKNTIITDANTALIRLEKTLEEVIAEQMISDVPIGSFLSGGYDSSVVVAFMQKISQSQVKTFSIGFKEDEFNEAEHARKVADYLKTDHHERILSIEDAIGLFDTLDSVYDEPFADSSQLPTLLLSQCAREQVTVSLSGDGGDELFAGYPRYPTAIRSLQFIPFHIKGIHKWSKPLSRHLYSKKINKFAKILELVGTDNSIKNFTTIRSQYFSHFALKNSIVKANNAQYEESFAERRVNKTKGTLNTLERFLLYDQLSYLPGDILTKVDRAAMHHSLEVRIPLLDRRMVELAWQIDSNLKLKHNNGKWIFRKLAHKFIPSHLLEREKQGFGIPVDEWLRGPLRERITTLVKEMQDNPYLDGENVNRLWKLHLRGQSWGEHIWTLSMFQKWYNRRSNEAIKK